MAIKPVQLVWFDSLQLVEIFDVIWNYGLSIFNSSCKIRVLHGLIKHKVK